MLQVPEAAGCTCWLPWKSGKVTRTTDSSSTVAWLALVRS